MKPPTRYGVAFSCGDPRLSLALTERKCLFSDTRTNNASSELESRPLPSPRLIYHEALPVVIQPEGRGIKQHRPELEKISTVSRSTNSQRKKQKQNPKIPTLQVQQIPKVTYSWGSPLTEEPQKSVIFLGGSPQLTAAHRPGTTRCRPAGSESSRPG